MSSCGGEPLPRTLSVDGVGEGRRVHLHVIGQFHDLPSQPGVRLVDVATCQAKVHETVRALVGEGVRLVTIEGLGAGLVPERAEGCSALGLAGVYAGNLLVDAAEDLVVTGWEDPAVLAAQASLVGAIVQQDRRRRQLGAYSTAGGSEWTSLDDPGPWLALATDQTLEASVNLLLREDAWEHARSAIAIGSTLALAESLGQSEAVVIIGSRHLDDIIALGQTSRLAPRLTVYDCAAE